MDEVNNQTSLFEKNKPKEIKPPIVEKKKEDISDDDTYDVPMCELKNHSWRDSWLKIAIRSKHIVFCAICHRTKFNDDGTVKEWLLKQGYEQTEDKSDEYVIDVFNSKRKTL